VIALDIDDRKLAMAKELGADDVLNAKKTAAADAIMSLTKGSGVDLVVDLVGHQETVDVSLKVLRRGGKLLFVGYDPKNPFQANSYRMVSQELEIAGSRASSRSELRQVVDLVQRKKIRAVVTETYSLPEVNNVLARLAKNEIIGRAVLKP
jgi:D-arabinose 1-dehydrogenase-like Zn-dependent alcohol dehydrogenase